mmetsp:Transcript_7759/g.20317  ORF Transcript_7759/g.20317 Transcript_7759/m.20317 type:complete len:361 (+) Transcript_7759:439-1521(+)
MPKHGGNLLGTENEHGFFGVETQGAHGWLEVVQRYHIENQRIELVLLRKRLVLVEHRVFRAVLDDREHAQVVVLLPLRAVVNKVLAARKHADFGGVRLGLLDDLIDLGLLRGVAVGCVRGRGPRALVECADGVRAALEESDETVEVDFPLVHLCGRSVVGARGEAENLREAVFAVGGEREACAHVLGELFLAHLAECDGAGNSGGDRFEDGSGGGLGGEDECVRERGLVVEEGGEARGGDARGVVGHGGVGKVDDFLRGAAAGVVGGLSGLLALLGPVEDLEGGEALDAELLAKVAVLVRVDGAEFYADGRELLGGLIPGGGEALAVAAPGRVELDEPGVVGMRDERLEVDGGEFHDLGL